MTHMRINLKAVISLTVYKKLLENLFFQHPDYFPYLRPWKNLGDEFEEFEWKTTQRRGKRPHNVLNQLEFTLRCMCFCLEV